MADPNLWRKNIPADFDGRQGDGWDSEVDAGVIYKVGLAVAIAVMVAFGVCWMLILGLETTLDDPYVSPIEEASLRRLPPTPLLQAHPERDWDVMLEAMNMRLGFDPAIDESFAYGWIDEPAGRVHIPIARAMDLVLASAGGGSIGARQLEPIPGSNLPGGSNRLGADRLEPVLDDDLPNLPEIDAPGDVVDDSGFAGSPTPSMVEGQDG